VFYRYHPLYGRSLRVYRRMKNRYGEHLFCEVADGSICALPAWIFSPECAKFSIGSPLICAEAMRDLRDVLSTWQAAHGWDKASQEQSPREVVRESTAKLLHSQLNLLLSNAPKTVIPDENQRELVIALMELLIEAAQERDADVTNGGGDEHEANR
jgi:hypothetical protein